MAVALSENYSSPASLQWFALHVKPCRETSTQMALAQQEYETLLPVRSTRRQWSDRVRIVDEPLFPGYLFCRFDVHKRLPVLLTPGVNYVVGFNKKPIPIEDHEVEALRAIQAAHVDAEPWHQRSEGEWVRLTTGPLRGVRGVLTSAGGKDRLVVSVPLIQRSIAVEVCPAWVADDDGAGSAYALAGAYSQAAFRSTKVSVNI